MQALGALQVASKDVFDRALTLLDTLSNHFERKPNNVSEAIKILNNIRKEAYEDLNQIQHEYLIIQSAKWLKDNNYVKNEVLWYWHPQQTGGHNEPDLVAEYQGTRIISAEVTTSERPKGSINSRVSETLLKLNKMPGKRFYFVRTESMRKNAQTKVTNDDYDIQVELLLDE
jgi:hypothetical protein